MNRRASTMVLLLALGLAVSGAAVAADVPTLGADGEIYQVVSGSYGDLFPGGSGAPAGNSVLALEIYRPGVARERLLVPTTEDPFPEQSPAIIFDPASQTPFLVWQRWKNFIHPELNLVQLTADGWSGVAELSGNPFREKSSPTFAITHDTDLRVDESGKTVSHERIIVHLVWLELDGADSVYAQYSPVVIEDGAFIGTNPVYRLNQILEGTPPAAGVAVAPDLARTIAIGSGADEQSVNIAVADPASGRLATVTVRAIPRELTELSDALGDQLVDFGSALDAADPSCHRKLADFARQRLADFGNRFQSGFIGALADELTRQLLASDQESCDVEAMAEAARIRVSEFGGSFLRSGIAPLFDLARQRLADFGNRLETGAVHHQVLIGLVTTRPAPGTGAGKTTILPSRSGKNLLVAWEHEGLLSYRETRGDGWSQEFVLQPQGTDGLAAAYQALRDRIRDR